MKLQNCKATCEVKPNWQSLESTPQTPILMKEGKLLKNKLLVSSQRGTLTVEANYVFFNTTKFHIIVNLGKQFGCYSINPGERSLVSSITATRFANVELSINEQKETKFEVNEQSTNFQATISEEEKADFILTIDDSTIKLESKWIIHNQHDKEFLLKSRW